MVKNRVQINSGPWVGGGDSLYLFQLVRMWKVRPVALSLWFGLGTLVN